MGNGRKQRIAEAKDNLAKEGISTAGLRGGQILKANKKVINSDVREKTTSAVDEFQANRAVIQASKGPKVNADINVKDAFKMDQGQSNDQGIVSEIKSTNTNANTNVNQNKAVGSYESVKKFQDPTHKLIKPKKHILEEKIQEQFDKDMPNMGQTPKTGLEEKKSPKTEGLGRLIRNAPITTMPVKPKAPEVKKDNTKLGFDEKMEIYRKGGGPYNFGG